MDKAAIEQEARRLQIEIYGQRDVRYPLGVPDIPTLFDPRNVADHCELHYEERGRLDVAYPGGPEAAGVWDRDRSTILISTRYSYETQRFTGGHEIGHFILHPKIGDRELHRERPINGSRGSRPLIEREADYFSLCLLMPRQAIIREFSARFGSKHPLVLNETVAFYLKADMGQLFSQAPGSLLFAQTVANAQSFGRQPFKSLASYFGVSPTAMAIRLQELGLIADYLAPDLRTAAAEDCLWPARRSS